MSSSRKRARVLRAGIAASALVAAMLATTATPAFAVDSAVTISSTTGATGGGATITATSGGVVSGGFIGTTITGISASFNTGTCPTTYSTTASATNIPVTSPTKTSADVATIVVPEKVVPASYNVCVFGGTAAGAAIIGHSSAPYVVSAVTPVLSPTSGLIGAGGTVTATVTGASYLSTIATGNPGATMSVAACPGTYTTTGSNIVVTAVKTSGTVATLTIPTSITTPNTFNVCIYAGATAGSSALLASATYAITAPTLTMSAASGLTGGGNTITGSSTGFLGAIASPGVTFSTATCPANYTTTGSNYVATNITKMSDNMVSLTVPASVTTSSGAGTAYNVCVYTGTTTGSSGSTVAGTGTYTAMLPVVTLSTNVGTTAVATPITATGSTNFLTGLSSVGVLISNPACPALYATGAGTLAGTTPQKVANNKVVTTVPTSVTTAAGPDYNVCIYNGTSSGVSALLATSGSLKYTVFAAVGVTTIAPSGGPAAGMNRVTISGSNLPTAAGSISATIGGYPLTDVQPGSSSYFTAVMPPHAASAGLNIRVTTPAGTFTSSGTYAYSNGITISPNTGTSAAASNPILVDVTGVGFSAIGWGNTDGSHTYSTGGHVYLVAGVYDPTDNDGGSSGTDKTVAPIAECTAVMPIGDTELFCTLQLDTGALDAHGAPATAIVPDGTYTLTVVDDGRLGPALGVTGSNLTSQSIISSGSTFTVAPY